MPISFPTNPSSGDTYDYGGIHYIFNNDGWVNKSIYGISAGTNISFSNYNGTGPIVISATDTTGITSAVTSFNGKTGAVQGVSSFAGLTGTVGSGITTNAILYFDGSDVQGSALLTFDGSDIVLDTSGHFDGNMLGRSEVYIKADEAINEGDPVYVTGSVGASERLTVAKADSAISAKMPAAGIAAQSLALNGEGVMIINGWVRNYNTTGLTANQTLFVASGGGLTATRPTSAGVLVQNIARVGRPNSANGSIIVTGASRTNDVPNALRVYQYIEMPDGFTFNTVVSSFNGSTGPVTFNNYVSSFNGSTGAVQGVSSINGSTGAITNVAFTNVNNLFSSPQTISSASPGLLVVDSSSLNEIDLIADTGTVYFYNDASGGEVNLKTNFTATTVDVTLPNYTTTVAGLAGTQTFTGANTFSNNLLVNTARLGRTGSNLVFGVNAGGSVTSGTLNTIIGDDSGDLISSGANNTSLGYETLTALTTGVANTAVGMWALRNGTTGSNNTAVGSRALRSNTTGNDNTAIGYYALDLNETGIRNTAIGNFALANGATAASNNVAIGYVALYNNTSGTRNIAVGVDSLRTNTTASNNVGIGYQSLYSATSGGSNTGVGTSTAYRLTTGINNTAIGYQALFGSASVTSQANTAVGYNSMVSNTSGSYNSGIGIASLYSLTSGAQNTAVGTESLYAITNTSNNTAVGQLALRYATQGSDNTAIGILAGAYKTASNTNLTTIGSNNVYIGSEARASGDSINNEIVIGSKAVGLGANTAVIGATGQASATIYGLFNAPGGISASGATFSGPIQSTRLARITSAPFEAKTTNWSPTNADDGKIFTVNISGKSTITCTVDGLSAGIHFKILLISGNITFSSTSGTFTGLNATSGMGAPSSATLYCTSTNNYFVTDSA